MEDIVKQSTGSPVILGSRMKRTSSFKETGIFLIAGSIDVNSPAEMCGLLCGDLIIQFGTISAYNFESVRKTIAPYCRVHKDMVIKIKIQRRDASGELKDMEIEVVPQTWTGEGLLGCHLYNLVDKSGPFVKVKDVLEGSPAWEAGLQTKDHIIEFGPINAETYVDLTASISPLIASNLGLPIPVLVKRIAPNGSDIYVSLKITPGRWGGAGYVGAALKTITPPSLAKRMVKRLSSRFSLKKNKSKSSSGSSFSTGGYTDPRGPSASFGSLTGGEIRELVDESNDVSTVTPRTAERHDQMARMWGTLDVSSTSSADNRGHSYSSSVDEEGEDILF